MSVINFKSSMLIALVQVVQLLIVFPGKSAQFSNELLVWSLLERNELKLGECHHRFNPTQFYYGTFGGIHDNGDSFQKWLDWYNGPAPKSKVCVTYGTEGHVYFSDGQFIGGTAVNFATHQWKFWFKFIEDVTSFDIVLHRSFGPFAYRHIGHLFHYELIKDSGGYLHLDLQLPRSLRPGIYRIMIFTSKLPSLIILFEIGDTFVKSKKNHDGSFSYQSHIKFIPFDTEVFGIEGHTITAQSLGELDVEFSTILKNLQNKMFQPAATHRISLSANHIDEGVNRISMSANQIDEVSSRISMLANQNVEGHPDVKYIEMETFCVYLDEYKANLELSIPTQPEPNKPSMESYWKISTYCSIYHLAKRWWEISLMLPEFQIDRNMWFKKLFLVLITARINHSEYWNIVPSFNGGNLSFMSTIQMILIKCLKVLESQKVIVGTEFQDWEQYISSHIGHLMDLNSLHRKTTELMESKKIEVLYAPLLMVGENEPVPKPSGIFTLNEVRFVRYLTSKVKKNKLKSTAERLCLKDGYNCRSS